MYNYLRIYRKFMKQQLKVVLEYKKDFFLGVIGIILVPQLSLLLILFAVFTQIPSISGFSFYEILLFYGFAQWVRGIDNFYNDNLWDLAFNKIRDGSFSQILIRPIRPLFHIIIEKVKFEGLVEVFIGLVIFLYAKSSLYLHFGWQEWGIFIFYTITSLVILFAIKLLCASLSFWTVTSGEFMNLIYQFNSFSIYPLDIYKNNIIKFILSFVLPFSFISYYPMLFYISESGRAFVWAIGTIDKNFLMLIIASISFVLLCISLLLWNIGIRKYSATGT